MGQEIHAGVAAHVGIENSCCDSHPSLGCCVNVRSLISLKGTGCRNSPQPRIFLILLNPGFIPADLRHSMQPLSFLHIGSQQPCLLVNKAFRDHGTCCSADCVISAERCLSHVRSYVVYWCRSSSALRPFKGPLARQDVRDDLGAHAIHAAVHHDAGGGHRKPPHQEPASGQHSIRRLLHGWPPDFLRMVI